MSELRRLKRDVSEILDVRRFGGSLMERDDATLIVDNYPQVSLAMLNAIQTLYPALEVSVLPAPAGDAERAGLVLVITCFQTMHILVSTYALQLCLANVACACGVSLCMAAM